jgi:RND superfamily putative drug exporter
MSYQAGLLPPQLTALAKDNMSDGALRFSVVADGKVGSEKAADALLAVRDINPEKGDWLVGGIEADAYDTNKAYMDSIPYALIVIAISMVVLLTLLLASLAIPIQAIVINMVSLAISFAILTGVFQLGWFGVWHQVDGIVMTPLVLIATIAFGLAMDYSVFLYSRMYEVYEKTGDSLKAIQQGIIKTGPIITAAALMVFVVVIAFAGSGVVIMQMIGLGLGVAVLVDAFFVRLLLVPSIMTLMGKASWYAPKWIKRLRIKHE